MYSFYKRFLSGSGPCSADAIVVSGGDRSLMKQSIASRRKGNTGQLVIQWQDRAHDEVPAVRILVRLASNTSNSEPGQGTHISQNMRM